MLILVLILINVQHSQKAAFSFEKGSNHQNHSSLGSLHPIKNLPQYNGIVVLCNCIMLKKKKKPLFMDGVQLSQGYSHFEEAVYFLPLSSQKFLVLFLSTSEG